jgi:hypothetical protein
MARDRRSGQCAPDVDRRGADSRSLLRPERNRLRLDGGARVVVPAAVRGTRGGNRDGGTVAVDIPRSRHVRHDLARRRGGRPAREHVPAGRIRRDGAGAAGGSARRGALFRSAVGARDGKDDQRMGAEHGAVGDAEGAVRLRLGLGTAVADDRVVATSRVAAGAEGGADRCPLLDRRSDPRPRAGGRRRAGRGGAVRDDWTAPGADRDRRRTGPRSSTSWCWTAPRTRWMPRRI